MTQAPEPPIQPPLPGPTPPPPPFVTKHSRLYQVAAWVVIVAGIVFVVAVIFFSGAAVAGYGHPWGHHHHGMFGPGGPEGPPPGEWQVFPGGPFVPGMGPGGPGMWPGPWGPGMGPGGPGAHGGHAGHGQQLPPPPEEPTP
jgi:hypothetical protein